MPKIKETIRDDGLRIITCQMPLRKIHVELVAKVGSAHDPPGKHGKFHLFEHMARKGTRSHAAEEIRLKAHRFWLSSFETTGKLETRYACATIRDHLDKACELLFDIYLDSSFPAKELEREKEVVLLEIARDEDMDDLKAMRALWEMLWKENPMRTFGVGDPEDVRSISRDELIAARDKWHIPSDTIAVAVGDITHREFLDVVQKYMPPNYRHNKHRKWKDEYEWPLNERKRIIELPNREKTIVIIGSKFPIPSTEREELCVELLLQLIGGTEISALWTEIREHRGLAYVVDADVIEEPPLGAFFHVYAECSPAREKMVEKLIKKILFHPLSVDRESVAIAKEHLLNRAELEFEGFEQHDDWARFIIEKIRLGRPVRQLQGYFRRIRSIIPTLTLEEVEAMRTALFKPERFATVIAKPARTAH